MEYVFVKFDPKAPRAVIANGDTIGHTDTTLMLPANFYIITLSGAGFSPLDWRGMIAGTQPETPRHITFTPVVEPPVAAQNDV